MSVDLVNNYIVRSCRVVIVATNIVTRKINEAYYGILWPLLNRVSHVIKYKKTLLYNIK